MNPFVTFQRHFSLVRYLPCVPYIPPAVAEMSKRGFGFIVTPLIHPHFPVRHECDDDGKCDDEHSDYGDDDVQKPLNDVKDLRKYDNFLRRNGPEAIPTSLNPFPTSQCVSSIGATNDHGPDSLTSVDGDQRLLLNSKGGFSNSFKDLFGSDWAILVVSRFKLSTFLMR